MIYIFTGQYELPVSCMKQPDHQFLLRKPNDTFIQLLKKGICQRSREICLPRPTAVITGIGDMILVMKVRQLEDATIFFLASLTQQAYRVLLELFKLYENGNIKSQVISKSKQGVGNGQQDCKGGSIFVHFAIWMMLTC